MSDNLFYDEFILEIRENAKIKRSTPGEVFFEDILQLLEEINELNDPVQYEFVKRGPRNKTMELDAYAYDESDKSLSIIINDYQDLATPSTLNNAKIDGLVSKMMTFLEEVYNNRISYYCDDSDQMILISREMEQRLNAKKSSNDLDESIEKIKLYIISNSTLSTRFKWKELPDNFGLPVKLNVFDFQRIQEIKESGWEKEPIILDLINDYGMKDGIPCVLANVGENVNYEAYLAIIPGRTLSDIYYKNDSKILEGNVRAFLSTRGNINKGIRRTILTEPQNFFTYNNGISTTAQSIKVETNQRGSFITKIVDFQIINGGQTTASLSSAFIKDRNTLEDIFVPMKLTVVKDENYEEMVSNIAKYANSQNKVTAADMFSNHPFHVKMESLSENIYAPPKDGEVHSTLWFYERSRGKYEQKQFRFKTNTERKQFLRKYPKNQVIKKEELAKYMNSISGKPHVVSRGSMRNMNDFAITIDKIWENKTNGKESINETYFRKAVCSAIIFKTADSVIYSSEWYEKGGYKSNIVTYTIAKIIDSIPNGYSLNFDKIWKEQAISQSFKDEIERVGLISKNFILDSKGVIVTEYCKKEETWKLYQQKNISLSSVFINELMPLEIVESRQKVSTKDEKLSTKVRMESDIVRMGDDYWKRYLEEAKKFQDFNYIDELAILVATKIHATQKMPNPKQIKEILRVQEKMEKIGLVITN